MRNWTIKEAVATIKAGTDADAIKEIARINPLFVVAVAKDDVAAIANMMGEKFTVRRLEAGNAVEADEDAEDVVEGNDVTDDNGDDADYSAMSTKELMKLCDKRGIKVPHYGKNKQFYIDALTNAGDADVEEEDDEEVEEAPKKAAKGATKKSTGKKPAKKAPVEEEDDEDEDSDWGDEDDAEEEEAPKAKAKKSTKPAGKKSAPKKPAKVEEEDEDDDWDI